MEYFQRTIWLHWFAGLLFFFSIAVQAVESTAAVVDDRSLFAQALRLSEQGNWPEAARLFRDIAGRHPAWPEPKNNLAVAMLKMGNLEQAQQALEEAVSSQPSFRTAQDNRKRLYDHLAALAYDRAVGKEEQTRLPKLDMLTHIAEPVAAPVVAPVRAPVQRPAPAPMVSTNSSTSAHTVETIRQTLIGWSRAWSLADVDAYLSAYSRRFKPAEPGKDYNQWRNIRRARLQLASNTQVTLDKIQVYLDVQNKQALAQFIQSYRSDNYQDRVLKQLHLANENGQWLILSERTIEQLN